MTPHSIVTFECTALELDMLTGIVQMHREEHPFLAGLLDSVYAKLVAKNTSVVSQMQVPQQEVNTP